jgi:hypothetical protein
MAMAIVGAMSTGLNCGFIEVSPGAWYYLLEDWNSPKGAWDWREYATAYGPFGDLERALEHLSDEHANPGGYWVDRYNPEKPRQLDEVLARLLKEAVPPEGRSVGPWR